MRKVLLLSPDHNYSDEKKKKRHSITELVSRLAHVLNHGTIQEQ